MADGSYSATIQRDREWLDGSERNLGGHGREWEWHGGWDWVVYDSGGGAESWDGDGYGDIGRCRDSGIDFCDGGRADRAGFVADCSDGHGGGWGGTRRCGDADCAVGSNSTAETRRAQRKDFY